jgi:Sucrase/ferredoxin-like
LNSRLELDDTRTLGADETCSAVSLAVDEPLPGTATVAKRWLLVEQPDGWERDVAEMATTRDVVARFDGRLLLIRRPDRLASEPIAFLAETTEEGGQLRLLDGLDDPDGGEPVDARLLLVCCHGRRDPCCARLGTPVFHALRRHVEPSLLWQSSHHGGHRFAANVLSLPAGIQLGRVTLADAPGVAAELAAGRIPLDHYRGRTLHSPAVQAADAAVRKRFDLRRIADVRLISADAGRVLLDTPAGAATVTVEERQGPMQPASCGAAHEPGRRYVVTRMTL